jgi:hypothetical protein
MRRKHHQGKPKKERKTDIDSKDLLIESRQAGWDLLRSHRVWFQANSIVDRVAESLFAAQVAFRRLYRNVSQQKLNLLQFPSSLMAQTGACPPEIVGREGRNLTGLCLLLHDTPNDLGAEACSPDSASLVDRAKEGASRNSSGHRPGVNPCLNPIRNRNRPDMTALAN